MSNSVENKINNDLAVATAMVGATATITANPVVSAVATGLGVADQVVSSVEKSLTAQQSNLATAADAEVAFTTAAAPIIATLAPTNQTKINSLLGAIAALLASFTRIFGKS